MQEFTLVNGELFPEHECAFNQKYESHSRIPFGRISVAMVCSICSRDMIRSFNYYGGNSVFDEKEDYLDDGGIDAIVDLPKN